MNPAGAKNKRFTDPALGGLLPQNPNNCMPGLWRPITKPEELQRGDVLCVFKGDVGQHVAIVTTTSNIPVANVVLVGVETVHL